MWIKCIYRALPPNNNLLQDLSKKQDVQLTKAKAKDWHYSFAQAIQGPSFQAVEGSENAEDKAEFLKDIV